MTEIIVDRRYSLLLSSSWRARTPMMGQSRLCLMSWRHWMNIWRHMYVLYFWSYLTSLIKNGDLLFLLVSNKSYLMIRGHTLMGRTFALLIWVWHQSFSIWMWLLNISKGGKSPKAWPMSTIIWRYVLLPTCFFGLFTLSTSVIWFWTDEIWVA